MKILITRESDNTNNSKKNPKLNEHVHKDGNTQSEQAHKKIRISAYDDNCLELTYTTNGSSDYVGNIYVGHVENIVANIDAAFVRFKSDSSNVKENIGYLDLKDVVPASVVSRNFEDNPKLRNGDIVLVQVKKPAVKTKQVVLTTKLSISGRYSAVTLGQKGTGCSKKLSEENRKDIIAILKHDFSIKNRLSDEYGLIARTECEGLLDKKNSQSKDDNTLEANPFSVVREEVDILCDKIDELLKIGATRSVATCLYETASDSDFSEKVLRCYNYNNLNSNDKAKENETDNEQDSNTLGENTFKDLEVITDDTDIFSMYNASSFHKDHPEVPARLLTPKDGTINILYGLSSAIDNIYQKKVWLDSGAYLVIESTEAMHVIDVNTGKAIDKKKNNFLNINIEAAIESARQIRLRNFSGMIMIDFINMDSKKDYKELENVIKSKLLLDPVKADFVDFTKLGIAELTRAKKD
jgi:ribonuclease G